MFKARLNQSRTPTPLSSTRTRSIHSRRITRSSIYRSLSEWSATGVKCATIVGDFWSDLIKGRLSDGMVTRSILLQIDDSQLGAKSWFRSKIHILFLRAYAWNDEIFFCLLRFTNNVWISSRRGAGSHRSVEESMEWSSHLTLWPVSLYWIEYLTSPDVKHTT